MTAAVKKCALCRQDRPLLNSHLLAAAIYKSLRAQKAQNPDPVHVKGGSAFTSSKQIDKELLCQSCEQLLHQLGEDQVLRSYHRKLGEFKLPSLLTNERVISATDRISWYEFAGSNQRLIDAMVPMVHFAVGVTWKASVWPSSQVSLGPYREIFRHFVLEGSSLPETVTIYVQVARPDAKLRIMWPPTTKFLEGTRIRVHEFAIPGIIFSTYIGKPLPPAFRACDIRKHRIFSIDHDQMALAKFGERVAGATAVGALASNV